MQHLYNLSGEKLYNKAQEFLSVKKYDDYAIYLTMAANYDYPDAINDIIYNKWFKMQNFDNTYNFYFQTSNHPYLEKNSYSLHYLARMYRLGISVESDCNKAIELYKKSIDKGCIHSITALGYTYESLGKYSEAINIYKIGINKETSGSYNNLALIYMHGKGVEKKFNKAEKLLHVAIEKNNPVALNNLIILYKKDFFADKRDNIIQYFNKINRMDKLVDIYNFDEYTLTVIKNNYKLKNKNANLKTKNNELQQNINKLETHIAATPDGQLYLEAKKEWDTLNKC